MLTWVICIYDSYYWLLSVIIIWCYLLFNVTLPALTELYLLQNFMEEVLLQWRWGVYRGGQLSRACTVYMGQG